MRKISVLVLIIFLFSAILPVTCQAETNAAGTDTAAASLTVEDALKLALANNTSLKAAALTLDAASLSNDLAWDTATGTLEDSQVAGTDTYESDSISSMDSLYTSDYNLKSSKQTYSTKLKAAKYSVYNRYYDVVAALDDLEAARLASEQADENLKQTQLRFELGMDTRATVYSDMQKAASAKASYDVAQQDLDKAYIAMNEYIGLDTSARPTLIRELTYTPLDVADPEKAFESIVSNSPSVWLANQAVKLQKKLMGDSDSEDLDDVNLEKADLNVTTTRDTMISTTRTLYYSALSLEESYNTAVETVKSANEALRVAKLMQEQGMSTKLSVLEAEITANSAQKSLDSISYQHGILAMAFKEPWAYGAAD